MIKFRAFIFSVLSILCVFSQNRLNSYVCGYSQLVSANGKQRIDLIYDFHIPCKYSNPNRLWINSCHRSEKSVYNCLKNLDKNSNEKIDLIWESHNNANSRKGLFISHAKTLKKELINQINLIDSDIERNKFEQQMLGNKTNRKNLKISNNNHCNFCGHSHGFHNFFSNPFKAILGCVEEMSSMVFSSVVNNLGVKPANYFKNIFNSNRQKLRNILPYSGKVNIEFLLENEAFHEIADLEMLENILKSDKKRVIVYAGCFHCKALKKELSNLGYKNVKIAEQNYNTISPKQMKAEKIATYLA